ncbi:hypothetical protein KDH_36910 [Dictyobacter sp. S3.2.2.5]|uniref:Uncharacterized protein n=1 Tax=Dictyobacter halimunensis TaxID=3026934 RepID=A0ABQ6FSW2_9CHLR|nr:hypothetical protein KDH_36910 [Dictyobacter sp. S3.2.2.5]
MLREHWMEMRAIGSAQSALRKLAKLLPDMAERIANGVICLNSFLSFLCFI